MLRRIIRYVKITFIVLFVLYTIISIQTLKRYLYIVTDNVNTSIEGLIESTNILANNQLALAGMIQDNTRYSSKLNEFLQEKLKEPDINKIINSDVFVQGFLGTGGGTIIGKNVDSMYIITCYHVVADVYSLNKNGIPFKATIGYSKTDNTGLIAGMIAYGAEIIKVDEEHDLALLKTSAIDENLTVAPIAKYNPQKGDTVYSVGTPLGLMRTISKGILCNHQEGFYISDNTTTFGNSGGGLYNIDGELIGIPSNVMGYDNALNVIVPETSLGLSRDLPTIKEFLKGVNY